MSQPYPVQKTFHSNLPPPYQLNAVSPENPPMVYIAPRSRQNRQRNGMTRDIYYPKFHTITGIIVLLLSVVMIAVEIYGSLAMEPYVQELDKESAQYDYNKFLNNSKKVSNIVEPFICWTGSWVGLTTLFVGLLQLIAGVKVSRCCLIAAMTLEGTCYFFLATGLGLSSAELASYSEYKHEFSAWKKAEIAKKYPDYDDAIHLNLAKAAVVLTCILILGILFLIDLIVTCYELCCRTLKELD